VIEKIGLINFKCFVSLSLDLKPLTLLTGFNAAGKSTAIQALLAIAQTCKEKIANPELLIDGAMIALGSPAEIVNDQSQDNKIGIEVCSDVESLAFELLSSSDSDSNLLIEKIIKDESGKVTEYATGSEVVKALLSVSGALGHQDDSLSNALNNIVYISATRDGALDIYSSPKSSCVTHADVGPNGEFAAWWFARYIDEDVPADRCHSSDSARTFRRQFNAWASSIFPGVEANANKIPGTDFVKLQFRSGVTDNWRKPGNIGYGLTYVFPILVACLLAKKGQTVVIDSPEAHLHPLGQSKIGMFLATVAESGVQVLIETHSDHILNGVRIAVKQSCIKSENMLVHFFQGGRQSENSPPPIVTSLVSKEGSLSDWPEGFFDQAEKDLAELAGWNNG
jgi:predicted ATPase